MPEFAELKFKDVVEVSNSVQDQALRILNDKTASNLVKDLALNVGRLATAVEATAKHLKAVEAGKIK